MGPQPSVRAHSYRQSFPSGFGMFRSPLWRTLVNPYLLLTFLVGLVFVGGAYAIELAADKTFALNGATGGAIAYVALFPALLAYIFWNRGVQTVGANAASQFHYLMLLWGSLLAVIFLGEAFRLFHLAGIVLIFGGVHLATSTRRADRPAPDA